MRTFIIKNKKIILAICSIILIYILLLIGSILFDNPLVFPPPYKIMRSFIVLLTKEETYIAILFTLFRLLISFLISFMIAFTLGILSGLYKDIEILLNPINLILKSIPVVAIIIIVMSISGFVYTPYVVTIMMIFPLIYQSTMIGIRNVKKEYIEVYKLDAKINFNIIKQVYFPLIKQSVYIGIVQSIGIGIKILVVTELMVSTNHSIGKALTDEKNNLNFDNVFAYSLILILIVLAFELLSKKIKIDA